MARWTDIATWRGPTPNQGGDMAEQRGLVVHIAEGHFEGTIAWERNPDADVSSHFVVGLDGAVAQLVDTDVAAWTQIVGNGHWLSVENEGFTPHALTAAQIDANAAILAKAHQVYGVPLQVATSPAGRGLGHHSMGAENGVDWGHPDCPGPAIIAQKPAIVAAAINLITGGDDMSAADSASIAHIEKMVGSGLAPRVLEILATVTTLAGKDFVDEKAIADAVLTELAGKDAASAAAALKAVMSAEQITALAAALTA